MGVIAKGIPRGYQGLFTPVSLGYPLSVFNKNSTLKETNLSRGRYPLHRIEIRIEIPSKTKLFRPNQATP